MSDEKQPTAVRTLPLSVVTADWSINPRHARNSEAVARYAYAYARRKKLPAPVVFHDGKDYWLSRGFHRFAAAQAAGLKELRFEVREGSRRDAMVYALPDNADAALPRSRKDLARLADLCLADPELSALSSRELGRMCDCSEWVFRRRRGEKPAADELPPGDVEYLPDEPAAPESPVSQGNSTDGGALEAHPGEGRPESPPPAPPVVPAASPAPARTPPADGGQVVLPRDRLGRVLPKHLVAVFEWGVKFETAAGKFGSAAADLKKLDGAESVGGFLRTRPHLEADARDLARSVRRHLCPFACCPACDGDGDAGQCPSCGGRGWVTRQGFEGLAPEMKERAKLQGNGDAWEGDDADAQPESDATRYVPAGPGLDPLGTAIPPELRDVFAADFLLDLAHRFDRAAVALNSAKGWLHWLKPETLLNVAAAGRGIRDAVPYAVCRKCKGAGCARCQTAGYVPLWVVESESAAKKK